MAGTPLREPMAGLPRLALPRPSAAVADCLVRQPTRRTVDHIAGSPLYIQRLGATVLPHVQVLGGWLCTLIATGKTSTRLPVGVCTVPELDLQTALVVNPWLPHFGLDGEDYLALWLVRVAQASEGCPLNLERALVAAADRETLQVITYKDSRTSTWLTSATRLHPRGVGDGIDRLRATGYLINVEQHLGDAAEKRVAFSIPPAPWPA